MAILLLIVMTLIFNWQIVITNKVMIGADWIYQVEPWRSEASDKLELPIWNPETTDSILQLFPEADYAREARKTGSYFWDPYPFAGLPALARGELYSNRIYFILSAFLPTLFALSWMAVVNMSLASIFMFMLLREIGVNRFAAILGSMAFAFNGYLVVWMTQYHSYSSMVWLPLIFLAFERGLQRKDWRWTLLGALVYALLNLSGYILTSVYSGVTLALYAAWRSSTIWFHTKSWRSSSVPLLYCGLILSIGAILSAPQLLLTLQLYINSQRIESYGALIFYNLKFVIARLLSPDIFGSPVLGDTYLGASNYTETSLYFGLLPLLFLIYVPFLTRRKIGWAAALFGLFALLAVHGVPPLRNMISFLYPVFLKTTPLRIFYIVAFTWVIAIALVADFVTENSSPDRLRFFIFLPFLLAAGLVGLLILSQQPIDTLPPWLGAWLASFPPLKTTAILRSVLLLISLGIIFWLWSISTRTWVFQLLAIIILVIDLFSWGMRYNPVLDPELVLPDTPSLQALSDKVIKESPPARAVNISSNQILLDLTAQHYRIPIITGYSSWVLSRYLEYVNLINYRIKTLPNYVYFSDCCHPLMNALNIRYVYAPSTTNITSYSLYDFYTNLSSATKVSTDDSAVYQTTWYVANSQKPVIETLPPVRLDYVIQISPSTHFVSEIGLDPTNAENTNSGASFTICIKTDDQITCPYSKRIAPLENTNNPGLIPVDLDLSQFAGKQITLQLITMPVSDERSTQPSAGWVNPLLVDPDNNSLKLVYSGPNRIYENTKALPRAWLVHSAYQVPKGDIEQVKAFLSNPSIDLSAYSVVETPDHWGWVSYNSNPTKTPDRVEFVSYNPERETIHIETTQPGWLVLSDAIYPGWEVTVDGSNQPVFTANLFMRSVAVPAGSHDIVFYYQPKLFYIGLTITIFGIVMISGLLIIQTRRHKINLS
jgi:hypothetical protein